MRSSVFAAGGWMFSMFTMPLRMTRKPMGSILTAAAAAAGEAVALLDEVAAAAAKAEADARDRHERHAVRRRYRLADYGVDVHHFLDFSHAGLQEFRHWGLCLIHCFPSFLPLL